MIKNTNITQHQLAKLTGVSYPTVSRVLNGHPHVSEATRKKVMDAVNRFGYRKNMVASSLVRKKTYAIGMISGNSPHSFWAEVIEALEQKTRELGYHTVICHSSRGESLSDSIEFLLSRGVDGLTIASGWQKVSLDPFYLVKQRNIPLLNFDTHIPGMPGSFLGTDSKAGTRQATEHLISLGHHRIAYLAGPKDYYVSNFRLKGWHEAMLHAGLNADDNTIVHANGCSWEHGEEAVEQLLNLPVKPTAVMAMNDPLAIGCYHEMHERGYSIPDDISLVGYAGIIEGKLLDTPLTSVVQPTKKLGERAAEIIIDLAEGRLKKDVFEELDDTLVIGKSSAPPATR